MRPQRGSLSFSAGSIVKEEQVLEDTPTSAPRRARLPACLAVLALLTGCATAPVEDPSTIYRRALAEAALAEPQKALPLKQLPQTATVRVVSWMTGVSVPCPTDGCAFQTGEGRLWVTIEGEVQAICRTWGLQGDALRERLEQLLGLPPHTPARWRKTHMVSIEVPRDALQRPCLGDSVDASGAPRCSLRPDAAAASEPELRRFVLDTMAASWVAGANEPGYPFTRLGYTYDWHPSAAALAHYGATEFVVRPRTAASLVASSPTDEYCRATGEK
jgi:hypothetical protein